MLNLPDDPTPYRVVGIDPGTDTLGVACLDVDLVTFEISLTDARTLHGARMLGGRKELVRVHGARFARLDALEDELVEYFYEADVHAIISESPFFNPRRPGAGAALVEGVMMVRHALIRFNRFIPLNTIDPASAKAFLKVSGKSGDKTLMTAAVQKLFISGALKNPEGFRLSDLDEHSIDAIAIGYYHAAQWRSRWL